MSWFLPGQEVRASPNSDATVQTRLESISFLPVSDEQGQWLEVTHRGQLGWINRDWQIPWERRHATRSMNRRLAEKPRNKNRKWLKAAKKILGTKEPGRTIGAVDVYTDVEDESLLDLIERVANITADGYFARYGRLPSEQLEESIVLFREREDYKEYLDTVGIGASKLSGGHAAGGLIVFWLGSRTPENVSYILAHEIIHMLNDRALALSVQPWLEEGLASDLGVIWIEIRPELRNRSFQLSRRDVNVLRLHHYSEKDQMPGIGALATLNNAAFTDPEHKGLPYAHAASLVRYLTDHPVYGDSFRRYLARIAVDEYKGTMGLLLQTLQVDIHSLDQEFRQWVDDEGRRLSAFYDRP